MDHFSLPIQLLCGRYYKELLDYRYGLLLYNHQTKRIQRCDEPVNHLLNYSFGNKTNPFLMPLFFVLANLLRDSQNDHHANRHYLSQWNIPNIFAILTDIPCSRKYTFLPEKAIGKFLPHKFHNKTTHALHTVDGIYLFCHTSFAKLFRIFYYKMNCLIFLPCLSFSQRDCRTKNMKQFALNFWLYLCMITRNIFALGCSGVAGNHFYNIGKGGGS